MAPKKAEPINKAVDAIKPSPFVTRQQANLPTKDPSPNEDLMEALKALFLPKFEHITSEIHAIQFNFQHQFQDLEYAVLDRVAILEKENSHRSRRHPAAGNITWPPVPSPPNTPTLQASQNPLAGGLLYFTPISKNQGFTQHLVITALGRRNLSSVRRLLIEKAQFKKGSVLNNYLVPKAFSRYHPNNLGDPSFKDKSEEERTAKMQEIVAQKFRTTGLACKPTVQLAVARNFHRYKKISKHSPTSTKLQPRTPINSKATTQPPQGDLFSLLEPKDTNMGESTTQQPRSDSPNTSTNMDATASPVHHPSSAGSILSRYLTSQHLDILRLQQEAHAQSESSQQRLDMQLQAQKSIWSSHCGIASLNPQQVHITSLYVFSDE
ncbi:hypothetical protein MAM1_0461d10612 [Mucor ambiguus]|uniref:Uncharacterized protein n=1 Tax=Mucor ambiguus TaxID=91626 RepID=A0A0C9N8P4_9FUNG|nr:hypothetical protein MAM1_0461d10612 [Mucor ambiguus]